MKFVFVKSVVGLILAAAAASASTIQCADQSNGPNGVGGNTLDNYIALNANASPGCMIGNLLFSDFGYSYAVGTDSFYVSGPKGTGTQQNPNVVLVAVNALNAEFQFGANWIVNHYQTATLALSFTVSEIDGDLLSTLQSAFAVAQGGSQNGGPTHTISATCTGGTCGSPTVFTNANVDIPPTLGTLTIVDRVFMNANGSTNSSTNNYHLSIITNQFAQTAPPTVPEPAVYWLTSAGIGMLVLLRRRRQ